MIVVSVKTREGLICGMEAIGHAEYDEIGRDIVCASVSVLMTTAFNALVGVCGIDEKSLSLRYDEESGLLGFEIDKSIENDVKASADTILRAINIGLSDVAEQYSKYVTLKYGRCNND